MEIRPKEKVIQLFDSLVSFQPAAIFSQLKQFFHNIAYTKQQENEINEWKEVDRNDIPLQTNLHDCGIFVLEYARLYMAEQTINFYPLPKNIRTVRKRIMVELVEWKMITAKSEREIEER